MFIKLSHEILDYVSIIVSFKKKFMTYLLLTLIINNMHTVINLFNCI